VSWDGPDDPANPLNWALHRKWAITLLTSMGGLVTLMSGSMLAPALNIIGDDLHIDESTAQMTLSIFVLAFAFGPMVLAPTTEVAGRRLVWIYSTMWYIIWNTICGFAHNNGLMLAARIFAGFGASAEFAVVVSCYHTQPPQLIMTRSPTRSWQIAGVLNKEAILSPSQHSSHFLAQP
jgi:predicted MFS family arabinose efflux permease